MASATASVVVDHTQLSKGAAEGDVVRIERTVDVDPGERLVVVVENTYPKIYGYDLAGYEVPASDTDSDPSALSDKPETVTLFETHEARYGGYILRVSASGDVPDGMRDLVVIIRVIDEDWRAEFSGGFTVSTLTDPKFGLVPDDDVEGQSVVVRERGRESTVRPGFASFVHLAKPDFGFRLYDPTTGASTRTVPVALSLGLGVDADFKQADLFIGPSVLFGDAGAFTLGLSIGGIDTAPAGLPVGAATTDSNALATLPTRIAVGGFFGFNYKFAGGSARDALNKPYKGAGSKP